MRFIVEGDDESLFAEEIGSRTGLSIVPPCNLPKIRFAFLFQEAEDSNSF